MRKLIETVLEGIKQSDSTQPKPNSLYIFWTAKITNKDGSIGWLNGVSEDSVPYVNTYLKVLKDWKKFKNIFIEDCEGVIEKLAREKYPEMDKVACFYDLIPTSQKFDKKYYIIWRNCMVVKSTPECVLPLTDNKKILEQWAKQAQEECEKIEAEMRAEVKRREEEKQAQQEFWDRLNTYDNYGYINNWEDNPLTAQQQQKYDRALQSKEIGEVKLGRGHYLYYSDKEKISWYVDSTD